MGESWTYLSLPRNLWQGVLFSVQDGITLRYLFDSLWPSQSVSPAGTIPEVHIYQSQDRSVSGPSGTDYSQMGTMCSSEFVCQSGSVTETNSDWIAGSVCCRCPIWCVHHRLPSLWASGNAESAEE